jgi:hypothetical protein
MGFRGLGKNKESKRQAHEKHFYRNMGRDFEPGFMAQSGQTK